MNNLKSIGLMCLVFLVGYGKTAFATECDIREAQVRLSQLGLDPGPIDGHWGRSTAKAIGFFQTSNELIVSSKLDSETCSALKKPYSVSDAFVTEKINLTKDILSAPEFSTDWMPPSKATERLFENIPRNAEYDNSINKSQKGDSQNTFIESMKGFKMIPIEGTVEVSGTTSTSLDSVKFIAKFSDWVYSYTDETKKHKTGWGTCVTEGKVLLPIQFLKGNRQDEYLESSFAAEVIMDKWVLVSIDPTKDHKFCLYQSRAGDSPTFHYPGTTIYTTTGIAKKLLEGWTFQQK